MAKNIFHKGYKKKEGKPKKVHSVSSYKKLSAKKKSKFLFGKEQTFG